MEHIIQNEILKFKKTKLWILGFFVLFGVIPYVHYNYLDGEYYDRVLVFSGGVNPLHLETDKDEYCPTETIYVKNSFCKTRQVESFDTTWWMSNGELKQVRTSNSTNDDVGKLPIGCYPANGLGEQFVYTRIHTIPENTHEGSYLSVGLTEHTLSGGRVRDQAYLTAPYYVKDAADCTQ